MATKTPTKEEKPTTPAVDTSAEGYIHNVMLSPSSHDGRFSFVLQGKRSSSRVLCFTPTKKATIEGLENKPIRVSNLVQSRKGKDLIMNANSAIEEVVVDYDRLTFDKILINQVPSCGVETLVTVNAKVHKLQNEQETRNHIAFRNISISDMSGSIRLTLWTSLVNACVEGKTYQFKNVRVKEDTRYGTLFLGTTMNDNTSITLIDDMENATTSEISDNPGPSVEIVTGEIVSVDRVTRFIQCFKCNQKLQDNCQQPYCSRCQSHVKKSACNKSTVIKVTFKVAGKNIPLTVFNDVADEYTGCTTYDLPDDNVLLGLKLMADEQIEIQNLDGVIKSIVVKK